MTETAAAAKVTPEGPKESPPQGPEAGDHQDPHKGAGATYPKPPESARIHPAKMRNTYLRKRRAQRGRRRRGGRQGGHGGLISILALFPLRRRTDGSPKDEAIQKGVLTGSCWANRARFTSREALASP